MFRFLTDAQFNELSTLEKASYLVAAVAALDTKANSTNLFAEKPKPKPD